MAKTKRARAKPRGVMAWRGGVRAIPNILNRGPTGRDMREPNSSGVCNIGLAEGDALVQCSAGWVLSKGEDGDALSERKSVSKKKKKMKQTAKCYKV